MKRTSRFACAWLGASLPQTSEKWQEVVDVAEFCLALESARQYGLVRGGPGVNVDRCEELLKLAAARGIRPHKDAIERVMGGQAV